MINKNPYVKTTWYDELVDPVTQEVLEVGTRFSARRANNIENGIDEAHELIVKQAALIRKMQVQMEIDGRVPGNSGSFFDTFTEEPIRMMRQDVKAVLTAPHLIGTTVLNVDNTEGFATLTEVTIYDGTNSEETLITEVGVGTIIVQALVKDYKKGAIIARSNADTSRNALTIGAWSTYKLTAGVS